MPPEHSSSADHASAASPAYLGTLNLATARIPLRIVIDGNTPAPTIITRDEEGRVRVSGDLSKLSAFDDGEGPANEIQAERAAHAICDQVLERTLTDRGVDIRTDDHAGRAA